MSVHEQARAAAERVYDDALAGARSEGRDEGYDAGFTDGENSRDGEVAGLRTDLGLALTELAQARAEYDAHMATHVPEQPPAPKRMLFGAAFGGNADPAPLEQALGVTLDVRRTYYGSSAAEIDKAVRTCLADKATGRRPQISFTCPVAWGQAATGAADGWADGLAQRLAELDMDLDAAIVHEPEGKGALADWLPMENRLLPRLKSRRVRVGAIFTGWEQLEGGAWSFAASWPTEAQFLGMDIYQQYGRYSHEPSRKTITAWSPLDVRFRKTHDFAKSVGVPWGVSETGVSTLAHAADPKRVAQLLALAAAEDAEFACWFDSNLNSSTDWTLVAAPKEPTDLKVRASKVDAVRGEVQRLVAASRV